MVHAAADVWRSQGRRVFALAVDGATAQRLASDLGDDVESMTIRSLLARVQHRTGPLTWRYRIPRHVLGRAVVRHPRRADRRVYAQPQRVGLGHPHRFRRTYRRGIRVKALNIGQWCRRRDTQGGQLADDHGGELLRDRCAASPYHNQGPVHWAH